MKTKEYSCLHCKGLFTARTADRARGWALYCSKRCKAVKQESKTGQHAAYKARIAAADNADGHDYDGGWDEHKLAW